MRWLAAGHTAEPERILSHRGGAATGARTAAAAACLHCETLPGPILLCRPRIMHSGHVLRGRHVLGSKPKSPGSGLRGGAGSKTMKAAVAAPAEKKRSVGLKVILKSSVIAMVSGQGGRCDAGRPVRRRQRVAFGASNDEILTAWDFGRVANMMKTRRFATSSSPEFARVGRPRNSKAYARDNRMWPRS
jgi:hypothetical protein